MEGELQPEPLWREVVGDTEPWRRGRIFLIIFAILTVLNHAVLFGVMILNGAIELLLAFGISAAFFWLLFYLIWIGVHWARWFTALCWGLWGFALLVWSVRDSNTLEMISGTYGVVVAAFLGFVPSVYFFAQRQRETRRVFEAVAVAVVVLALGASLTMAIIGLSVYKSQLEADARSFGDDAFQRLFARHDTYFLLDKISDDVLKKEGRLRITRFLQYTTLQAGDVHNIRPCLASLRFSYAFPTTLVAHAQLATEGEAKPPLGRINLYMRIDQPGKDWRINQVWWIDPRSVRRQEEAGR